MHAPINRPWVIAHRGAGGAARENTVDAFQRAAAVGADAVELDVRRTADGMPIVHHHAVLPGGEAIATVRRAELALLAPWVPDLEEALAACGGMWVNVEIKNSPGDPDWDPGHRIVEAVVELLAGAGMVDRVLLSSFNPRVIGRSRELCPDLGTGWLLGAGADPASCIPPAAGAGHRALHPSAETLTGHRAAGSIAAAHTAGLLVLVWTVDSPTEIARLAEAGADGIITNVPEVARSVLADRRP